MKGSLAQYQKKIIIKQKSLNQVYNPNLMFINRIAAAAFAGLIIIHNEKAKGKATAKSRTAPDK